MVSTAALLLAAALVALSIAPRPPLAAAGFGNGNGPGNGNSPGFGPGDGDGFGDSPEAERMRAEEDALARVRDAEARREGERRERSRARHLAFLAEHQRIAARRQLDAAELFPQRLRADYLRMRRSARRAAGGATLAEGVLSLVVWTAPFVALLVWQIA